MAQSADDATVSLAAQHPQHNIFIIDRSSNPMEDPPQTTSKHLLLSWFRCNNVSPLLDSTATAAAHTLIWITSQSDEERLISYPLTVIRPEQEERSNGWMGRGSRQ